MCIFGPPRVGLLPPVACYSSSLSLSSRFVHDGGGSPLDLSAQQSRMLSLQFVPRHLAGWSLCCIDFGVGLYCWLTPLQHLFTLVAVIILFVFSSLSGFWVT